MPADRVYADGERSGYFLACQPLVYKAQYLFLPHGQYFCVILFVRFRHLAVNGIDDQTFDRHIEQQGTIKAQSQPQSAVGLNRNIKHPVQHRYITVRAVLHAELARQVIIGALASGLMSDEVEKAKFLQVFAGQIIGVDEPEDLFLPDGAYPALFPVFVCQYMGDFRLLQVLYLPMCNVKLLDLIVTVQ